MSQQILLSDVQNVLKNIRSELMLRLVGQEELVEALLIGLITGGHVLVEGVPGLAKTLAVKTLAEISGLEFKRVQFTPDLLPADIVGTMIYNQGNGTFATKKGPIFANIVLADEVNRAPAKVQSALLEAMAEKQVTIGDETHRLPNPFMVLATQNPIEQEGAYQLPEAQLDRFLIKAQLTYPTPQEELEILRRMGSDGEIKVSSVMKKGTFDLLHKAINEITVDESVEKYIVSLVVASRSKEQRLSFTKYIEYGASPRATLALYRVSRVRALFEGRSFVIPDDVKRSAYSVLRHRLVLSYDAEAEEVTPDMIIDKILSTVAVP
ncbi:MAG: AAA family ATPase [Spirochaetia bacterium]